MKSITRLYDADFLPKNKNEQSKREDDHLYIDLDMLKEAETRLENVATAWIDNKNEKANDMISQTWIIECLKMKDPAKS